MNVKSNNIHAITCRQTLFGIHEDKTTLVLFEHSRDANKFMKFLDNNGFKMYPMKVEITNVDTVEKVCYLNYFDLFLVYNLLMAPGDILHADCYTLNTERVPEREYLNYQLEKYLRAP